MSAAAYLEHYGGGLRLMAKVLVKVAIPSLLLAATGNRREVSVEAETLAGALRALVESYPLLEVHLFQADGSVRPHVHLFYNDQNTQWLESLDLALEPGDTITVLQAVSGG